MLSDILENTCCTKAFKHGQNICPVCGNNLYEELGKNIVSNKLKVAILTPLLVLFLNSCKQTSESGIVKDKIDNKVYLTPVDDTANVYRVINFDRAYKDHTTKNLYLNMNKGDTVEYGNLQRKTEIIPSEYDNALFGGGIYYHVYKVNGVKLYDLPDLVRKSKEDEAIKKLQQEYQNAKQR